GQDRQADHLAIIPVEDTVVVDVHPLGKVALLPGLHLHVNQQPLLLPALEPYLDQLVHSAPALLRLTSDLLQLLVEHLIPAAPVDVGVSVRKEEGQAGLEVSVQRLLPGAVIVGPGSPSPLSPTGRSLTLLRFRHGNCQNTLVVACPPEFACVDTSAPRGWERGQGQFGPELTSRSLLTRNSTKAPDHPVQVQAHTPKFGFRILVAAWPCWFSSVAHGI